MSTLSKLEAEFFRALKPPPKLSLSEWADKHAVLSAESSADTGKWHTIPYQKGIMDAITDTAIEQVTVMKSARVGYTKIINHVIAYHIHQDPCSIMVVQPTIEDAQGYSKEEIAPMIRDTPVLEGLVSEAKAKDSDNTILQKMFPGGTLSLVGANSPRGFRRVSRRVVLFDEVDGYPASAGAEGDQIKLGIKRTDYFWNRKIVAGSTPTVKDGSRIERLFVQSDQRRYFVPCPSCGEMQYLKWANLKWPEHEPHLAYFKCEKNDCTINHDKKRWMVERGEWRPTALGNGKHAGFHIWAAYSYSPNAAWGVLAEEFLEAKSDAESLKTFINTAMGELWETEYTAKMGAEGLKARAETYTPGVVPEKAVVLTAGVDVQDNRFEISVYGWGKGEEGWLVSREAIYGDPGKPEMWKQLDTILLGTWKHESGGELRIAVAAVDTGGHFTHETYAYVRERRAQKPTKIIAVKGQAQRGRPAIGKSTKQDINFRGQALKWGVDLYPVGTDTIKATVYGRLKHNEAGPGYLHFHADLTDDFFDQITSERQVTRYVKGFPVREWVKPAGKRNEALDCLVYAFAALQLLYTAYPRKTIWEQLERRLYAKGVAVPPAAPAPDEADRVDVPEEPLSRANSPESRPEPLKKTPPTRNMAHIRRSKGFVNSW